jgi:hypothetical protein
MLIEGPLRGTDVSVRCLLVGSSRIIEELKRRTWDEPRVIRQGRVLTPWLKRQVAASRPDFDLCVAVVPMAWERTFSGLYTFRGTEDIRQIVDTTPSWDEVKKAFSKKKRQVVNNFEEKHGLSYRISKDPADFDTFYHRMHVPHIRRRFGSLSDIDSYADLKSFFEQGLLLFVTKDGTDVAGALSLLQDGMMIFRRSGVLDGDESHVKAGAQTALYYFQLRYAVEHGLRAVDAMKSSPFLNDGIYRHKAEWGATVWADDEAERWVYVFAAGPSEKAAHFFAVNPVVVQAADGLRAVIGEPGATDVPRPSFDTLADRYHARGLKGFIVVRPAASFDVP